MASLTTETQTEPAEKQCSVCYTDLDLKNTVITPCNHAYCSGCFFKWLSRKETCALCRKPLLSNALVEERTEELQNIQYELMESYRAHRVIKRDLKRKRRQMRNLNDDVQSLMGRQIRLRTLLDKTKMACEETVKRNDAINQAIKDQQETLKMLSEYRKEWEYLHTPLVEEKRSENTVIQEEKISDNIDVAEMEMTVEELVAVERRRALRDYARWDTNRTIRRLAEIRAREGMEEESGEEAVVEAETEEDNNTEEEEEDVAEDTTEEAEEAEHDYNTGDEYELSVIGTNIASNLTTPPRRRILRIPGAPRRRERELPSQSMFVFGANRNSPDTITDSVISPFEMPTLFNNSTNVPLDFNPHMNLFTPTDSYIPMMELTSSWYPPIVREAMPEATHDMPGNQAMTRLFAEQEQEQEQGPEPEPSEEISND